MEPEVVGASKKSEDPGASDKKEGRVGGSGTVGAQNNLKKGDHQRRKESGSLAVIIRVWSAAV